MEALRITSFGAFGLITGNLQAKNRKKVNKIELVCLSKYNTDIDKNRFVVLEHTINNLSFDYVHLPLLEHYFSFCLLVFYFSFSSELSSFEPLYAQY